MATYDEIQLKETISETYGQLSSKEFEDNYRKYFWQNKPINKHTKETGIYHKQNLIKLGNILLKHYGLDTIVATDKNESQIAHKLETILGAANPKAKIVYIHTRTGSTDRQRCTAFFAIYLAFFQLPTYDDAIRSLININVLKNSKHYCPAYLNIAGLPDPIRERFKTTQSSQQQLKESQQQLTQSQSQVDKLQQQIAESQRRAQIKQQQEIDKHQQEIQRMQKLQEYLLEEQKRKLLAQFQQEREQEAQQRKQQQQQQSQRTLQLISKQTNINKQDSSSMQEMKQVHKQQSPIAQIMTETGLRMTPHNIRTNSENTPKNAKNSQNVQASATKAREEQKIQSTPNVETNSQQHTHIPGTTPKHGTTPKFDDTNINTQSYFMNFGNHNNNNNNNATMSTINTNINNCIKKI